MTTGPIVRGALVALTVVTLPASRAEAFCHLFKGWFGAPATTTYYAPYTAAMLRPDAVKRSTTCRRRVPHGVCQCSGNDLSSDAGGRRMHWLPDHGDAARRVVRSAGAVGALYDVSPVVTAAARLVAALCDGGLLHSGVPWPLRRRSMRRARGPRALLWWRRRGDGGALRRWAHPAQRCPSLAAPTLNYPSAAPLTTAPPRRDPAIQRRHNRPRLRDRHLPLRRLALCRKARPAARPRCNRHPIRMFRLRSLAKQDVRQASDSDKPRDGKPAARVAVVAAAGG